MTKGVRRLDPDEWLPFGDHARIVRLLIVNPILDEAGQTQFDRGFPLEAAYFVHNVNDQTGGRPPGCGLSGGKTKKDEYSIGALEREIKEEVPFPIIGEPQLLLRVPRRVGAREERNDLYIARGDVRLTTTDYTRLFHIQERGGEVDYGRFFETRREIWRQPVINTHRNHDPSAEAPDEEPGFFWFHLHLFWLGMIERGRRIHEGTLRP